MNPFGLLQLIGGVILSTGYIPQIRQILRTRSVQDISLPFFVQVVAGILCMEVYAIYLLITKGEVFFLLTNTTSLVLSSVIVVLKVRYGKKRRR
jgi:MtN3 and saliva related transmembrane protein